MIVLPLFEIVALAGGAASILGGSAVVIARRSGVPHAPKLPSSFAMLKLVNQLPSRHRREARAIVAIAREHDKRHVGWRIDSYTARETLRSYLPETIVAYLAVPGTLRGQTRNGLRSPDDELAYQLYALRTGLERLRDADAEVAVQRMNENKTFLHDRFGEPPPIEHRPLPPILELLNEKLTAFIRGV
jgi:hypothetical protein